MSQNGYGEVLERKVDFAAGLNCPVRYLVRLVEDGLNKEELRKLAGKPFPKIVKGSFVARKLNFGVLGSPECADVPVRLTESGTFSKEAPTFRILPCKSGQAKMVYTSMYEPSTTGWGDPDEVPMIKFLTTKASANAHAKQRLKSRLKSLRKFAEEVDFESESDTESNGDKQRKPPKEKWPFVPSASLFSGDFPKGRRSKLFGNGVWTRDHRHTEKAYGDRLYVGLIRNWHGGHLDGCGNPEMEEIAWTEAHQVQQVANNSKLVLGAQRMKRPAAHGTTEKCSKRAR